MRIVARHADGWNVPFIAPDGFTHKRKVLGDHCAAADRDVADIRCAVNLGLAYSDESLRAQFGQLADGVRPGVLSGSDDEIVDRIGQYVEAGADQINIAMRAPWMIDDLERLAPLVQSLS